MSSVIAAAWDDAPQGSRTEKITSTLGVTVLANYRAGRSAESRECDDQAGVCAAAGAGQRDQIVCGMADQVVPL